MKDPFKKTVDRLLRRTDRSFKGIRLLCTICGEEAFARTPQLAEVFGWSDVEHVKGATYQGICVECKDSTPDKKGVTYE